MYIAITLVPLTSADSTRMVNAASVGLLNPGLPCTQVRFISWSNFKVVLKNDLINCLFYLKWGKKLELKCPAIRNADFNMVH